MGMAPPYGGADENFNIDTLIYGGADKNLLVPTYILVTRVSDVVKWGRLYLIL